MTTAGIDFGTTNSVVSIWTSDGPEVLAMDEPPGDWAQLGFDKVVPTVISIDDDSTTEFGWAAKTGSVPALEAVKRHGSRELPGSRPISHAAVRSNGGP
jgi:molecular chaperone DnaK (HSP70)